MLKDLCLYIIALTIGFTSCSNAQNTGLLLPEKPNILMITCEDISPLIGAYGDKVVKTPNIDRLAAEGVRYDNVFSVSGVCAPSRAALITGVYPTSIGAHNMRTQYNSLVEGLPEYSVVVPDGIRNYAEIMRENGYYVTNNVKTDYQFEGPFTAWDEVSDTSGYRGRGDRQPFFAIYNSMLTHESQVWRRAEEPQLVNPDEVPVPPYYPQDNPVIRKDIARVYSNIIKMDQWVGKIIQQLKADGLYDRTIIIFFSDHGGPLPRQKRELYDSGLKVPFIVRYPDSQRAGTVDKELHSFVDIPPSVLSLAGIEVPDSMQGIPFLGPQAAGKSRDHIFAARDRMDSEYDRVRAVRDKRFKYLKNYRPEKPYVQEIRFRRQMDMMNELVRLHEAGELNEEQELWFRSSKPKEELYDIQNDPYELNNLIDDPEYSGKVEEMRIALRNWQKKYGDLGAIDERELLHRMWEGENHPPKTAKVDYSYDDRNHLLTLSCSTPSASIGYQVEDQIGSKSWQVYTHPIKISPGQKVVLKAQRIGYEISEPVTWQNNTEKSNILFVLVDDLGYYDLGITGSKFYETPNIDKLGEGSYRFLQGYASSRVCSPSRAGIMTGVTPAVHGVTDWIGAPEGEAWRKAGRHTPMLPPEYEHGLPTEFVTLPEAMKMAGYDTFFAGKWHLGGEGSRPEDHGFDINIGGYEAGSPKGGYFAPYDNPVLPQGPDGENLSIRLAKETAGFIAREHEKPFFAMLSFYAVHGPIQTSREKWAKYRSKVEKAGIADHGYGMEKRLPIREVQDNPVYGGLVETMDDAVGIVLEALKTNGLEENTIVIFTSDHGGVASGDNFSTSNLPLRGGKGYQWEGGLRVPYFIKIPGRSGGDIETPVSNIDFLPTLVDMAGGDRSAIKNVEGKSLVPLLGGRKMKERALYWHYPHYGNQGGDPSSIIREGDWKLVYYWENRQAELYNLRNDPYEKNNLAASDKTRANRLTRKLLDYLEEHQAKYPYHDPEYDPVEEAKVLDIQKTERLKKLEEDRIKMLSPGWQPNADWWGSKVTRD